MKKSNGLLGLSVAAIIAAIMTFNGCKQDHLTLTTTSVVNIYTYMSQDENYSLFKQIVDKAGYADFLDTYGANTVFLPTNDGVNAYLKAANKANVDALDAATAKRLISIAVIQDTLGSQYFTDGKMRTPTTSGQYLITSAKNVNGVTSVIINKQAALLRANIRVGNGIIHVVDNVLTPALLTLAQTVEQNSKYSIFSAALKATGFYDTLNIDPSANSNVARKYVTLIAESDSTLKAAGFADFNALKAKYSKTGDPKNHADSLWLYVAYHVWPELSYVSDIATSIVHNTLAPLEITTSQVVNNQVLVNNDTFNGVLEPGQVLGRGSSDVSASNGVMHSSLTSYKIKTRLPSPVYFDVCAQPEIMRTPGLYKGVNKNQSFKQLDLADVTIVSGVPGSTAQDYGTFYRTPVAIPAATAAYCFNNDYMIIGTRFRTGANALNVISVTFKTPIIVRGRYRVWVDWPTGLCQNTQLVNTYFDGVALPNAFNHSNGLDERDSEQTMLAKGFKSYSESPPNNSTTQGFNGFTSRLLGTVEVTTTGRHTITFTATADKSTSTILALDAIEFRPTDMDQLRPKLGRNGTLIP